VQYVRAGHTFEQLRGFAPELIPYSQIGDSPSLTPGEPYCMPGDGVVPLAKLLDLLAPDAPLSLEYHHRDESYSYEAWAKHVLDGTRAFLERYYDSKR
jgi:sugar phosphate isomerase/epimerase